MRMDLCQRQAAWDRFIMFSFLVRGRDELHTQPKKHSTVHLLKDAAWFGNPRLYANWIDESLNKILKMSCRTCSQATLESSVLTRMSTTLRKRKADALFE